MKSGVNDCMNGICDFETYLRNNCVEKEFQVLIKINKRHKFVNSANLNIMVY